MDDNQNKETENVGHIVTADELVMDEATIIREQERLANEKKKKASAKKKKVLLIILIILLAGLTWYFGWGRKIFNKDTENTVLINKKDSQLLTLVRVNSIYGNEISVTVLQEQEVTEEESGEQSTQEPVPPAGSENTRPSSEGGSDSSNMPNGFGGQMPEGFSGQIPSGDFNGQMPEGFSGQMPGGFGGGSSDDSSNNSRPSRGNFQGSSNASGNTGSSRRAASVLTYGGKSYELADQTGTIMIPVGVVVTTKLGTETTFSRISTGDCLGIVSEIIDGEETIIAVYIVG